jgi:hypothetical protein
LRDLPAGVAVKPRNIGIARQNRCALGRVVEAGDRFADGIGIGSLVRPRESGENQ